MTSTWCSHARSRREPPREKAKREKTAAKPCESPGPCLPLRRFESSEHGSRGRETPSPSNLAFDLKLPPLPPGRCALVVALPGSSSLPGVTPAPPPCSPSSVPSRRVQSTQRAVPSERFARHTVRHHIDPWHGPVADTKRLKSQGPSRVTRPKTRAREFENAGPQEGKNGLKWP